MVSKKKTPAPPLTSKNFDEWVKAESTRTGKTPATVVEETFHDGFLVWYVEEANKDLSGSQLYGGTTEKPPKEECIRLRREFAPVSAAVDWIRDSILGGGITPFISDPNNALQKKTREMIEDFIKEVYQDEYTRSLNVITGIMVDEALTTGASGAEIVYDNDGKTVDFWEFATATREKSITSGDKTEKVVVVETKEPDWSKLKGINRLKIMQNAYKRFKLYRDDQSWEAKYWTLDETGGASEVIVNGIRLQYVLNADKNKITKGIYLHPWQVFWMVINRSGEKGWSEMGESVVMPVLSVAKLAESIMKAVGEGIYRAGNKKYFIICGTPERPWSGPHIRNTLQQLSEASKKNWSTIPMPAGFDVKEIGGEVFEGNTVIEYFLKEIAKGLNVPCAVLGYDLRKDENYDYRLLKINLQMAIEHQLFKRQVWAKYGNERTKQGGSTEPIYFPEASFRTEELLSKPDKLKMLISMLNSANPIVPQLKLEVERSIAQLMGWDKVMLPTQEELQKMLDEQAELEKKQANKKPAPPTGIAGEKTQGKPEPQTVERQENRLKGGVNVRKNPNRGKSREMGGTRMVQESVPDEPQKVQVDINVKGESTIKTEPLKIEMTDSNKEVAEEKIKTEKEKQKTEELKRKALEKIEEKSGEI